MKLLLVFALTATVGSVNAQDGKSPMDSSSGSRHMFEFGSDSSLLSVLSFSKSKTKGQDTSNNTNFNLDLNYAYSLPSMPRLQVGGRINYDKQDAIAGRGDGEDYGLAVGAIMNHKEDLRNSAYLAFYFGYGWAHTYGGLVGNTKRRDEILTSTLSLGKRMSLEKFGINHLTYSPEVALQNVNSTTGGSIEYRQDIQFRLLQFSIFF